jgi:hypothetical protein
VIIATDRADQSGNHIANAIVGWLGKQRQGFDWQ